MQINPEDLSPHLRSLSKSEIIGLLNNIPFVKTVPKNKGSVAEKSIFLILSKNFEIQKSGIYAGDFIIQKSQFPQIKIVIESKNYESYISASEFEKFERDCAPYSGGVFITNKSGFKILPNNLIILNSYAQEAIISVCELLWQKIFNEKHGLFWEQKNFTKVAECLNSYTKISAQLEQIEKLSKNIKKEIEYNYNILKKLSEPKVFEQVAFELPDPKFKETVLTYFADQSFETLKGDTFVYFNNEKKMIIKILKTKTVIYFKPSKFDLELDIGFQAGMAFYEFGKISLEEIKTLF